MRFSDTNSRLHHRERSSAATTGSSAEELPRSKAHDDGGKELERERGEGENGRESREKSPKQGTHVASMIQIGVVNLFACVNVGDTG